MRAGRTVIGPCGRRVRAAFALASSALVLWVWPARAAEPARADTTVEAFLEALSDSADTHFGVVTAPADTAGLDSARVFALGHPEHGQYRRDRRFDVMPVLGFNRVDGPVMGFGVSSGSHARWGRLSGEWADATGPNLSLGSVSYEKQLSHREELWKLRLSGGRRTAIMDREAAGRALNALSAFISGADHSHYLRRDGVTAKLSREGLAHRLTISYRDELESQRSTTATWNLFNQRPEVIDNLPARFGRARELGYEVLWRVQHTPVTAQLLHATSSRSLGSDFEYRRTLAAAGADVALGRTFALVPQVEYGALNGAFIPQAAFYLGSSRTLRSLPVAATGGSRLALARLDLIMVRDVFDALHLPHPSPFPVQLGVFAAAGSVWGADPVTGQVRPGGDWPHAADWRVEAGGSLMYQPGIPDPALFVRFNWAVPLGPGAHDARLTLGIGRGLDLLKPFEREQP